MPLTTCDGYPDKPDDDDDEDTTDDDTGFGNSDDGVDGFKMGATARTTAAGAQAPGPSRHHDIGIQVNIPLLWRQTFLPPVSTCLLVVAD